jgi:streptomycin 6-kinase
MGGIAQSLDAQALADLHAPSHPAPPLPLTPQEKLFLRMLRYGNLTQLAELDPIVRAQRDADETTAFKAFFPDPPPLKQPLGDAE